MLDKITEDGVSIVLKEADTKSIVARDPLVNQSRPLRVLFVGRQRLFFKIFCQ